jgi:hypothetical protein
VARAEVEEVFLGDEVEQRLGGPEFARGFEDVGDALVRQEALELDGFFVLRVVVAEGGDDSFDEEEGFDAILERQECAANQAVIAAQFADRVAGDSGDGVAEGDV